MTDGPAAEVKLCGYGGAKCGPQEKLINGVCGMHNARYQRHGSYELLCSVGGEACGPQTKRLDGMCRDHYYAGAEPCVEEGCEIRPTAELNKFVKGRCVKHQQQAARAELIADNPPACRIGVNCGPQGKLFNGLCRKHHWNLERFGSLEIPPCSEEGCTNEAGRGEGGSLCSMHFQRNRRTGQRKDDLGVRLCPNCGTDMSVARRNSKYCSEACTRAVSNEKNAETIRMRVRIAGALRKARKQGNPGSEQFTVDEWVELIEDLNYRCTYCGEETPADDMHMDHIVPLSKGGPHALHNITPACSRCNISKKDRVLLLQWAPVSLGGRPPRNKTAPWGQRRNRWVQEEWRDEDGPLLSIMRLAAEWSELVRAIQVTEAFIAAAAFRDDDATG